MICLELISLWVVYDCILVCLLGLFGHLNLGTLYDFGVDDLVGVFRFVFDCRFCVGLVT